MRMLILLAGFSLAAQAPLKSPVEPYKRGEKYGLQETATKKEIIPPLYEYVAQCYEGRCAYKMDGRRGFLEESGKIAIPASFDDIHTMDMWMYFSEGLCAVKSGGVWGYIDRNGAWKIKPRFSKAQAFHNGLAAVDATEPKNALAPENHNAAWWSRLADGNKGNWGFIDVSGAFKIPAQFEKTSGFSNGRAYVEKGGKWGVLATDGSWVVAPQFDEAPGMLKDGLILVKQDGKAGFVDKDFKFVLAPAFEEGYSFDRGMAAVKSGGLWGYIGVTGEFVIAPRFQSVSLFDGEAAVAEIEGGHTLIDRAGRELCAQRFKYLSQFDSAGASGRALATDMSGASGLVDRTCRWFPDAKP